MYSFRNVLFICIYNFFYSMLFENCYIYVKDLICLMYCLEFFGYEELEECGRFKVKLFWIGYLCYFLELIFCLCV